LVVHADDVGIGKTIEAALIAVRYWTEAIKQDKVTDAEDAMKAHSLPLST
jgi:hypothetical protein